MKKVFFIFCALLILACPTNQLFAEEASDFSTPQEEAMESDEFEQEVFRAKVLEIIEEDRREQDDEGYFNQEFQDLRIKALDGRFKNREITFTNSKKRIDSPYFYAEQGDLIVVYWSNSEALQFSLENIYRLNKIYILAALFFLLIIIFTKFKGVRALASLGITLAILIYIVAPQIANGTNPLFISAISAFLILGISIFLGHGIKTSSIVAFISAAITLILAILLSWLTVKYLGLTGLGTEDAYWLFVGNLDFLNLQSLLLAGIIISIVGILDDVTIVQASLVEEIHKMNKQLTLKELYKKGITVGKEHIISMVNTLIIIYAGVALPILVYLGHDNFWGKPFWARLNEDSIVEEIARALAGSTALVLAVPITTLLAAYVFSKQQSIRDKTPSNENKNEKDEK